MIIMEAIKEMNLTNVNVDAEEIKQLGLVIKDILQELHDNTLEPSNEQKKTFLERVFNL